MRYVKAVLVGLIIAVMAAAAWVFVVLIVPVALPMLVAPGSGAATANVGSGSVLAAALVGFVAGVWWRLRKTARPTSA